MKKTILILAVYTGLATASCKKKYVYQCIDQAGIVNGEVTTSSEKEALRMCTANSNGNPGTTVKKK